MLYVQHLFTSGEVSTKRAIVYIDGFNLYFGMRDNGWSKY
jgi:hypothetical protein